MSISSHSCYNCWTSSSEHSCSSTSSSYHHHQHRPCNSCLFIDESQLASFCYSWCVPSGESEFSGGFNVPSSSVVEDCGSVAENSGSGRWVVGLARSLLGCAPSFGPRVYKQIALVQIFPQHYYLNSCTGKKDLSHKLISVLSKLTQTGEESLKLAKKYFILEKKLIEQKLEPFIAPLGVILNGVILVVILVYRQVSFLIFSVATFALYLRLSERQWIECGLFGFRHDKNITLLHQDDYSKVKDSCSTWIWVKDSRADEVDSSSRVNADGESCRHHKHSPVISLVSDKVFVEKQITKVFSLPFIANELRKEDTENDIIIYFVWKKRDGYSATTTAATAAAGVVVGQEGQCRPSAGFREIGVNQSS
ncbi:unnamed protein product [Orchesella dallaii]|uniref:Uncharacterized protein n=1 Tax=Orchesella dallaii TaxID=48710 RepID=A0ABP1QBH1_9HEXA